ncbi:helix-turn-helix transcriptional regulator [Zooshikella sp. RANM57]|uniref:helix-turn-helix transcriptional regulator n=1 Tax=Zooshikella sp. RANM57 TaxID=3425863 RepID=UPI003D6EA2DB
MIIKNNHPLIKASTYMPQWQIRHFSWLPINQIVYNYVHYDYGIASFGTDIDWFRAYWEYGLQNKVIGRLKPGFHSWTLNNHLRAETRLAHKSGLKYKLDIVIQHENYCQLFSIGSLMPAQVVLDNILSNYQLFQEKLQTLANSLHNIIDETGSKIYLEPDISLRDQLVINNKIQQPADSLNLTHIEKQCLDLLNLKYSTKEMANSLGLSEIGIKAIIYRINAKLKEDHPAYFQFKEKSQSIGLMKA